MKLRNKLVLTLCLLLVCVVLISGCSAEKSPYDVNDAQNYNVSVKFDANGGLFTTNTSVITDSFNISGMQTNNAGQVEIPLLAPNDSQRGKEGFNAYNAGYFLAGWYAERVESTDAQGNKVYTYSDKWDFSTDKLKVHSGGSYSSSTPVLTLYAAWVPMFEIEFYCVDSGEYLDTMSFDPGTVDSISVPAWNMETGAIDMNDFPARNGYTYNGVYLDQEGTQEVTSDTIIHSGKVDYETGTCSDKTMKLYVDWLEGEWFHIYTAEQFVKNAKLSGNYVIHEDLDFEGVIWPTTLIHGAFSGTIQGNGHSFRNIEAAQNNNSKTVSGLFGQIKQSAQITDLTIENATFTIKKGARVSGASFGLLAGQIDEGLNLSTLKIVSSTLQIDSNCAFLSDDYSIGLITGGGSEAGVDASGITCVASGEEPESVKITMDGNAIRVEKVSE
ncbi:MAG: hypothetical protein IJW14_05210 [Oscillospiraceae bacterium]|nr:hypothetical protein [Oscillospiraceae bacterium]